MKYKRKIFEIIMSLTIVLIKSSTPLVSIDKNDKLDLLIVENLSIVSSRDYKDDSSNHREGNEQLCAIKELLISNNIIIQKLCEIEAKIDGVKSHPLSTYSETRLHNVSDYLPLDIDDESSEHSDNIDKFISPLITKCIDKKKNSEDVRNAIKHLNRKIVKPMTDFDMKMRKYIVEKPSKLLANKLNNLRRKENMILSIAKQKSMDLNSDALLTMKKQMKDEDFPMRLPYIETVNSKQTNEPSNSKQTDIVIS